MKKIIVSLVILFGLQTIQAQKSFKPLFDGKSTKGWHSYGKKSAGKAWKAADGILHFDSKEANNGQGGDLVTDAEFRDFHLKLDWKIAQNGNSGIIFYVNENPVEYQNTYSTGLEMQILDNEGHPDAKILKHRAGDLYDLVQSRSEPVKQAGEWNTAEILSRKGKLTLILNGVTMVETVLWEKKKKKNVSGSKFADWPDFGTFNKGKIALQDHGNNVWFRNIMIKELD